jgi:hypothetical protein
MIPFSAQTNVSEGREMGFGGVVRVGEVGCTVHAVDGGVWLVDIFHGDSVVEPLLLQVRKMSKTIPLCSCLKILSPPCFLYNKTCKHDTYLSIKHQNIIIHTSRRFREDLQSTPPPSSQLERLENRRISWERGGANFMFT